MPPNLFRHTNSPRQYIRTLKNVILPELEDQKQYWKQQFLETLFKDQHTPFHQAYLLLSHQQYLLRKEKVKKCKQLISQLSIA